MKKAFVLAAGKGERMMPLTAHTPKPLLSVGEHTILDYQLQKLIEAGITEVIVNVAYLGEQIENHIRQYHDITIHISKEPYPLETAGAIRHARGLLGDEPFLLVNGDVWIDLDYRDFLARAPQVKHGHGYLVFVPNPEHKKSGDFCLEQSLVKTAKDTTETKDPKGIIDTRNTLTFSGVSILSPALINDFPFAREAFPLREVFEWGISRQALNGELYTGYWLDVGTPERLQALQAHLQD